jgi:hypothetical protein
MVRFGWCWIFCSFLAYGQLSQIKGTLKADNDSVIAFAQIRLLQQEDSTFKRIVQSDESGFYYFKEISAGNYRLKITSFEVDDFETEVFQVKSDTVLELNLRIKRAKTVSEVTLKGQREMVRMEEGKMVVNVESTLSNSGQTAVEVLRKAPGVSVDQDGTIQLRGKNGVQVMIDDKVMYLSGDQLASLLRAIPAEQIKEIEIITSPSAKYDASGNAGIINIRLKKGAYEGLTGRMNSSFGYGRYHKGTAGFNLTYKKKKQTLNVNYQYSNRKGFNDFGNIRVNDEALIVNNYFKNATSYIMPNWSQNLQLTGEYRANKKTSYNYDFNNTFSQHKWEGYTNSELRDRAGSLVNTYASDDSGMQRNINSYSSIGFNHRPDTLGTSWSGLLAMNKNVGWKDKIQQIDTYNPDGSVANAPFQLNQTNDNHSNLYLGQLDYVRKVWKKVKVETGVKHNHLEFENPFFTTISDGTISDIDSRYFYKERIFAGYGMATWKRKNWSFQAGLRAEKTLVTASYSEADTTFRRNYTNLFPSGNISFKQSENTSYSLSFSRRITRPSPEQLNPVLNFLDPFSAWGGDAYLLPQFTNTGELTYSVLGGKLITGVNYSYITNPIVWVSRRDPETGVFIDGMRNLDFQTNLGGSVSLNLPFAKWWSANYNFNIGNNTFVGDAGYGSFDNQLVSWTIKSTQKITLPKEYSMEISGFFDSPSSYAFYYNHDRWQVNAALQKRLMAKKATIKIAVNDAFWTYYFSGYALLGPVTQKNFYRWDNRTVILSFTYKFGNPLMKQE